MFIVEVIPLRQHKQRVLSFYHPENLPAGSLVEVLMRNKRTKAVVINSQSIKYLKIRIKKEANFELKPISKVLDKNPHSDKDLLEVTFWFPTEKFPSLKTPPIRQPTKNKDISTREILGSYLKELTERKAVLFGQSFEGRAKAKNYMQETAEPYLKYIDWQNDTFEKDMRLFWVSASNYYKSHTHHDFVQILEWIKKKDSLTPKQVAKLFNKG